MTVNSENAVQPSPGLTPVMQGREAECLLAIVILNNRNGRSPSLEEIAAEMKISRTRALHYVERLEDSKFISRTRGADRRVNRSIEINFETVLLFASTKNETTKQ